jgi:lipopolysaccharide export system protein LptA
LTARYVEAHVVRDGARNEMERLWTEGGVRVLQAPAGPDDKGVDVRGETLQLTRQAEGNILVVTDANNLAQVRLDKIYIAGPQVNIDQVANKVWVDSAGAMQIDSNTNFRGDKLNRTVPLVITWDKNMFFENQFAEFHGGVQSEQENARMLCQSMQVFFDRPISLKQGDKGGPPAKVSKLIASQKVRVEDREIENGKLVKYQRIECPELAVDNAEGSMQATGPGLVRLLQRGNADTIGPSPSPAAHSTDVLKPPTGAGGGKPGEEDELKLTIVYYSGRMYANNTKHTAVFIGDVEVTHVPSENPNLQPNLDKLPVNGLYLKSDKLEVSNRPGPDGKSNQEMTATGHVYTQSRDTTGPVTGRAIVVKYNEAKDQVIFEGGEGGYAILWREKVVGQQEEMKGKKIIYMRRTNTFQGVEMNAIKGVSGSP